MYIPINSNVSLFCNRVYFAKYSLIREILLRLKAIDSFKETDYVCEGFGCLSKGVEFRGLRTKERERKGGTIFLLRGSEKRCLPRDLEG